jgi:hypothetical protein
MVIEPFAPGDFRLFDLATEPAWVRTRKQAAPRLTRTRAGQLLLGRRVDAAEVADWSGSDYARAASETLAALRDCFRLR